MGLFDFGIRIRGGVPEWITEAIRAKKYAFAADCIRFYAVFKYGGFYLDTDVEIVKPFDDLLDKPYCFAYENRSGSMFESGIFGAEENNPFIGDCFEYFRCRHFLRDDGSYDIRILPHIMNEIYAKHQYEYEILGSDFFTCKSSKTGAIAVSGNTYSIHHFAMSWQSDYERRWTSYRFLWFKLFGEKTINSNIYNVIGYPYVYGIRNTIKKICHKIKE